MSILLNHAAKFFPRPKRMDLPEFATRYVKIGPEKAPFDLIEFPWLRKGLEMIQSYDHYITGLIMAAQIGKGRCAESSIPYFIKQDPSDLTWYSDTNDRAKAYAEERIMPLLANCHQIKQFYPTDRHKLRTSTIHFTHMVFEVCGANETNTQSKTRRIIFCDEAWKWERGRLAAAISRTSAPHLQGRRKVVVTSTAGDRGSDLESLWEISEKWIWSVKCPHCQERHPLGFSKDFSKRIPKEIPAFYLKWDTTDVTRPGGDWDLNEVRKTVRYECPSCQGTMFETPEMMRHIRRTGEYIQINDISASPEKKCIWCPRMAAGEWGSLVERFLRVNEERKSGFEENFREFMLKDLAEPYEPSESQVLELKTSGDYIIEPQASHTFQWVNEKMRFMTVDVQALTPKFWYSIEAWAQSGESRRIECGSMMTWEQVEDKAEEFGLVGNKSIQVSVDAGHEPDEVWGRCAKNRWIALRGDDDLSYRHPSKVKGAKDKYKPFSPQIRRSVGMGTKDQGLSYAAEFMWSNLAIKNILFRLKTGQGLYYGVPANYPEFYAQHMDAEYRRSEYKDATAKTVYRWVVRGRRANHLWDCSCMNLVCAFMANLIPVDFGIVKEENSIPTMETI